MIEVRDTGREVRRLRWRLALAWLLMVGCFGLLSARFYWLQVHRYEAFHAQAEDNRIALVPIPPARGLIYDRNGVLLADNRPAYTLEIIPEQV
ncbi:MAG: penicillin-binding protein 2, partial [Quisquiliibacterium sp.]